MTDQTTNGHVQHRAHKTPKAEFYTYFAIIFAAAILGRLNSIALVLKPPSGLKPLSQRRPAVSAAAKLVESRKA